LAPPILKIENLTVSYRQGKVRLDVLRNVNLAIHAGTIYGLVGESGSGKSTLALAIMNYLSEGGEVREGSIQVHGRELTERSAAAMRQLWQHELRLIPQNPLASLNPALRIGEQIEEALPPTLSKDQVRTRARELLAMVHLADPDRVLKSYPHQLSGGQQQRILIAMALSGEPTLLVMDEPTTNLDVTTEAAILELVRELIAQRNTAVLYVTHNMGVVAQLCDRVAVLYAGELVEDAAVLELFQQPLHPYTQALLDSVPRLGYSKSETQLRSIPGQIPQPDDMPAACVFEPRCPLAIERCARERPELEMPLPERRVRCHRWEVMASGTAKSGETAEEPAASVAAAQPELVLDVVNLRKQYPVRRNLLDVVTRKAPQTVQAVNEISFQIQRRETLGLVGESGSGKSTAARCIVGLAARDGGDVRLLDMPLPAALAHRDKRMLRHLQMVLQSPDEALNPYLSVGDTLRRPLMRLAGKSRAEADQGVARLLALVRLSPTYMNRMPDQLSGGEKQRVAIARAFASQPDLLLLDESVSGLDVSVQATILNLLNKLQQEKECAYLFISHDLAVVSYLADVIAVIYLGRLMEVGRTQAVLAPPFHPYTEALLSAIPVPDPTIERQPIVLEGEAPSPINLPSGCPFHTRCHRRPLLPDPEVCVREAPPWRTTGDGHRIYCHIPLEQLRRVQARNGQHLALQPEA
jgi:peptide/nickel transport system ATP-binding protein